MPVTLAAWTYAGLMAVVIAFQLALAAGAPWGAASMGGAYPGKYPPRMRWVALANAGILAALTLVVLARAGLAAAWLQPASGWAIWIVVVFAAVGTVMNTITRSRIERIWAPVTAIQLVAGVLVALG